MENDSIGEATADKSTDEAWEQWGQRDPYFGVITHPKFRRAAMNEDARKEFFASGTSHVNFVLTTIRKHIAPEFAPQRVLDFGCGVGRLLVPFAAVASEVVGLDVSPSMLLEAQRNCEEQSLHNVKLLASDDDLSALNSTFDLIHSFIVLQHIPVDRGRKVFSNLLRYLSPGGVAAIHLTYSTAQFSPTQGLPQSEQSSTKRGDQKRTSSNSAGSDPEMQMNPYNMNEILFLTQRANVHRLHLEFTDHGYLGAFLFFSANPHP